MSEQGRPGRYARTTNGLIASMIVCVVAVVAFVGLRALFSRSADQKPAHEDYLATVQELQQSGFDPVYPAALPPGWYATNVDYTEGAPPKFGISFLTAQGHYVGVQEAGGDLGDLLSTFVDSSVDKDAPLSTPGDVAPQWAGWSDHGGDHAFTATLGQGADAENVVVFGSAPLADIETMVKALSVAKVSDLPTPTPSATQTF